MVTYHISASSLTPTPICCWFPGSAQPFPPPVWASLSPQAGTRSHLTFTFVHHTDSVVFLYATVTSKPSVPSSGSHRCLRSGTWLTVHYKWFYLPTYLLQDWDEDLQNRSYGLNSPSAHREYFSRVHMGSKMTQTKSIICSLIIHVHKNWFHSLLAKCLPNENRQLFIAKLSVIMLLLYIIYNHCQPESHGGHSTAASADRLICRIIA